MALLNISWRYVEWSQKFRLTPIYSALVKWFLLLISVCFGFHCTLLSAQRCWSRRKLDCMLSQPTISADSQVDKTQKPETLKQVRCQQQKTSKSDKWTWSEAWRTHNSWLNPLNRWFYEDRGYRLPYLRTCGSRKRTRPVIRAFSGRPSPRIEVRKVGKIVHAVWFVLKGDVVSYNI